MAKDLHESEIQQSEYQNHFTRQLWEEKNAISLLQHEFDVAKEERYCFSFVNVSYHVHRTSTLQSSD